ncbi:MAG TPA: hypothetical protein VHO70_21995 [Chitinispirillaceae bacterium]|nr:hypothetical protein [Chitinispirillaceae bacterium]
MIFKKNNALQLCIIVCLVSWLSADEQKVFSQPPIPSIFTATRSSYSLTDVDLNTSLYNDPLTKRSELHVNSTASQSFSENGLLSIYGNDFIQTGKNKSYDFGPHALFYSAKKGIVIAGVGIGYDYDRTKKSVISETVNLSGGTISDKNSILSICDWEENSIFANVNGSLKIVDTKKLLFGIEIDHTVKNGIEYNETSQYSTDTYLDFQDNITYFNYGDGAYKNRLSAGVGLLHEYLSKSGLERLFVASMIYEQEIEQSSMSLLDGVQSYFSVIPDNIQFSEKNNYRNSITLELLLSEQLPDQIYLNISQHSIARMYSRYLSVAIQYSGVRNAIRSVNQWNLNDTYYGTETKKSQHYPLALTIMNVTDLILFRNFHVRFDSHFNGMIEFYSTNQVVGSCDLECIPSLGFTLPVKKTVLLDVNYSPFPVYINFKGMENWFDLGFEIPLRNIVQLRVALLF